MNTHDYLTSQALIFISNIDKSHPAFADFNWDNDEDALIREAASICRKNIVRVPIKPIPQKLSTRIVREGEDIPALLKRCSEGHWKSVGVEFHFQGGLDYQTSPDPGQNTAGVNFGEWIWQINRHSEWSMAAQYFNQSNDDSAAEKVATWLRNWLEQCPCPDEDLNGHQASWRTIEIGIRMGSVWPQVLSAFADHPAFDDVLFLAWLQCYAEQAAFVYQYRKRNNWLLMEMNGLCHAGVQIAMHKDAALWRQQAQDALVAETATQFHDDGMQVELSASYHVVCFNNYMRAVDILRIGQHEIDARLEQCIRNMLIPCRALARANGYMFDFQDSHAMNLKNLLKQVPAEWLEESDHWFLNGEGTTPPQHHVLKNAGYVILRSGYNNDDVCVAFDGGPYGDAHQHEDKLSIQIHACGQDLIGEAGIVDYSDTPERRYSLTTLAHSTAIVDGLGQNRRLHYADNKPALDTVATLECDLETEQAWASAMYDEGYGPDLEKSVSHKRTVTLLDKHTIQILDTFTCNDENEHKIEILFHAMKDKAELNDNIFKTIGTGANAQLTWSSDETNILAAMHCGGHEPDLRGWGSPDNYDAGLYEVIPRPCLTLALSVKQEATVTTNIIITAPAH